MKRFEIVNTPLAGVVVVRRQVIADERGFLERLFCMEELCEVIGDEPIAQINRTLTRGRGVVRGMHFQHPPHAETKVVCCLRGRVYDVAVDLRRNSPTFLRWHAEILDGAQPAMFIVPKGCAHGFQTLSEDVEMLYCHTAPYTPAAEGAVHAEDMRIGIRWPAPITAMSPRDAGHARLSADFAGLPV